MLHVHAWQLQQTMWNELCMATTASPLPALAPVTEVKTTLPQGIIGSAQQWRGILIGVTQ